MAFTGISPWFNNVDRTGMARASRSKVSHNALSIAGSTGGPHDLRLWYRRYWCRCCPRRRRQVVPAFKGERRRRKVRLRPQSRLASPAGCNPHRRINKLARLVVGPLKISDQCAGRYTTRVREGKSSWCSAHFLYTHARCFSTKERHSRFPYFIAGWSFSAVPSTWKSCGKHPMMCSLSWKASTM